MLKNDPRNNSLHDECHALNAAFDELGFEWQWDPELYASLADIGDERERLAAYVSEHHAHLLKVYDLTFLCDAIVTARRQHRPPFGAAA
jgi:hypothetical protein